MAVVAGAGYDCASAPEIDYVRSEWTGVEMHRDMGTRIIETPGRYRVEPGRVVVWIVAPHDRDAAALRACTALLSAAEVDRAQRFHFARDRDLFVISHVLVRLALSQHQEVEPSAWRFSVGRYGRPEIEAPASRLRFSLSHARGLAACAVTIDDDIGFDVEDNSRAGVIDLAEDILAPGELAEFRRLPAASQARRIFEIWTLKEAYLKARGVGLMLQLDQIRVIGGGRGCKLEFGPDIGDDAGRWRLWAGHLGRFHQAALAVSRPLHVISRGRQQGQWS